MRCHPHRSSGVPHAAGGECGESHPPVPEVRSGRTSRGPGRAVWRGVGRLCRLSPISWDRSVNHVLGPHKLRASSSERAEDGCGVVAGLESRPALAVGVGSLGFANASDQACWAIVLQDVEQSLPIGEPVLDECRGSVRQGRRTSHIGHRDLASDRMGGGFGLASGHPVATSRVPERSLSVDHRRRSDRATHRRWWWHPAGHPD
jgi:hypothetical protein